jgi:hypothetical protein
MEVKRLRTRYRILTEIVSTEYSFVQDMQVLKDCYLSHTDDCPPLSPKHKQTIFGRLNSVLTFANDFQKELEKALAGYEKISEDQINEAELEQLVEWDKETTIGDVFWSSVSKFLNVTDLRW